jgi:hypothetical protein
MVFVQNFILFNSNQLIFYKPILTGFSIKTKWMVFDSFVYHARDSCDWIPSEVPSLPSWVWMECVVHPGRLLRLWLGRRAPHDKVVAH